MIHFIINYKGTSRVRYQRVAKGFCGTRDGPKICRVTRDWTQIIRGTRDRTSRLDM